MLRCLGTYVGRVFSFSILIRECFLYWNESFRHISTTTGPELSNTVDGRNLAPPGMQKTL